MTVLVLCSVLQISHPSTSSTFMRGIVQFAVLVDIHISQDHWPMLDFLCSYSHGSDRPHSLQPACIMEWHLRCLLGP